MGEPLSPEIIARSRKHYAGSGGWEERAIATIDARNARIEALEKRLAAAEVVVEGARSLVKDADAFGEMILVGKDGPKPDRIPIHTAAKLAGRGSVSTGCSGLRAAVSAYDALLTPR